MCIEAGALSQNAIVRMNVKILTVDVHQIDDFIPPEQEAASGTFTTPERIFCPWRPPEKLDRLILDRTDSTHVLKTL